MREITNTKGLLALAALLVLPACVDTSSMGSPAYVEGWRLGCYSGYADAGAINYRGLASNTPTYGDSPEYQPAWEEGYRSCFDDKLAGIPALRTLPPSDGEKVALKAD